MVHTMLLLLSLLRPTPLFAPVRACRLVTDNRVLDATALLMLWWPVPEGHVTQPPSGGKLFCQPQHLVDVRDEDSVELAHLWFAEGAGASPQSCVVSLRHLVGESDVQSAV